MTDKKMTDKDIIKASECLCGCALKCRECPYSPRYPFPSCQRQVAKDTLALITRQQAKIENLKVENQSLRGADNSLKMHYEEAQAEIERLKDEYEEAKKRNQDLVYAFQSYKSEAVKEFAERLKEKYGIAECIVTVDSADIDNLVKEMGGENND